MRDLKIAAVSMHSEPGRIEENLDRMTSFVRDASGRGADIVCFPELSITGYVVKDPERVCSSRLFEEILQEVLHRARRYGILLLAGAVEYRDGGGGPFITHIVAGPEGLLGLYRKTHLSPQERETYLAGDEIEVFSCMGASFGVQLCYEAHFPEISTLMALKGAEIIFVPHASPRAGRAQGKIRSWMRHLPGRAFDNALFVVACNQVGRTGEGLFFPGVVLALNPAGRVIASYSGSSEKMLLLTLKGGDLKEIRGHRMKYFLPYRRAELYRGLVPGGEPGPFPHP